jgi:hypothetical protein
MPQRRGAHRIRYAFVSRVPRRSSSTRITRGAGSFCTARPTPYTLAKPFTAWPFTCRILSPASMPNRSASFGAVMDHQE